MVNDFSQLMLVSDLLSGQEVKCVIKNTDTHVAVKNLVNRKVFLNRKRFMHS